MSDRLVADGDRPSTGGVVFAYSDFFNEEGKAYARKENKATCGNCKGAWPIYGTAGDWMDGGEPYVKDGDRVLCPCGRNIVFAAGSSNAFYSESKGEATATPTPQALIYDQQFMLRDSNGRPLSDTYYTVRLPSGELVHGITDNWGRTSRHETTSAQNVRIYLGHKQEV